MQQNRPKNQTNGKRKIKLGKRNNNPLAALQRQMENVDLQIEKESTKLYAHMLRHKDHFGSVKPPGIFDNNYICRRSTTVTYTVPGSSTNDILITFAPQDFGVAGPTVSGSVRNPIQVYGTVNANTFSLVNGYTAFASSEKPSTIMNVANAFATMVAGGTTYQEVVTSRVEAFKVVVNFTQQNQLKNGFAHFFCDTYSCEYLVIGQGLDTYASMTSDDVIDGSHFYNAAGTTLASISTLPNRYFVKPIENIINSSVTLYYIPFARTQDSEVLPIYQYYTSTGSTALRATNVKDKYFGIGLTGLAGTPTTISLSITAILSLEQELNQYNKYPPSPSHFGSANDVLNTLNSDPHGWIDMSGSKCL